MEAGLRSRSCCNVVVLTWLWCSAEQCFKFPHERCTTLSAWDLVSDWLGEKKIPMMERRERTAGMLLDESLEAARILECQALGVCFPARKSCRDHPAHWELIVTSASCSALSCPLLKSSLLGMHWALSSILWWDRSNPVFCLLCDFSKLESLLSAGCWTPGAWCATFCLGQCPRPAKDQDNTDFGLSL